MSSEGINLNAIAVGGHIHYGTPVGPVCAIVTEINDDGYTAQTYHEGNADCPVFRQWESRQRALAFDWIANA